MKKGFTLIELLIVIAIIAVLAAVVFVALNPLQRFQDARNSRRWNDINSIIDAIRLEQVDQRGILPAGIDTSLRMLGTAGSGCDVRCGGESNMDIAYHNSNQTLNYYSNNTYTVRNWFNASAVSDFSVLTVSAVLDCDGSCSGQLRFRIGNASSYTDYDFVDAANIRTDSTTSNYTWYSNSYNINKNSLGDYFFVQLLLYNGSGTVKFLMDEVGPTGPDPGYRSGLNGDGSQTGWTNDNGDYFIKINLGTGQQTQTACLDLSGALSSKLSTIPFDPSVGSAEQTYYVVKKQAAGQLQVIACGAEGGGIIQLSK